MLFDVFSYKKWNQVLKYFHLNEAPGLTKKIGRSLGKTNKKGIGESRYHKRFKEYIYKNARKLGIRDKIIRIKNPYSMMLGETP